MSLDEMVSAVVFDTLVADDAVYVDESGQRLPVRVVPERSPEILLRAADLGVRGVQLGFYLRKAVVRCRPRKGEHIEHGGSRHCIAMSAEDFSPSEWLVYVLA